MQTTWADWVEWKERCALALCEQDVRQRLAAFAHRRFHRAAERAAHATNLLDGVAARVPADPEQAWHLFETHALVSRPRTGKVYKEWLFARLRGRSGPRLSMLEAGASLMIRDVTRNYLKDECLPRGMASLDTPVPSCRENHTTYADLLPSELLPSDAVEARELQELAREAARAFMEPLSNAERAALAARLMGVPLQDPRLLAYCGRKKSWLHLCVKRTLAQLPDWLAARYPDEHTSDLRALAVAVIRALEKETILWANVENVLPELFHRVEGGNHGQT